MCPEFKFGHIRIWNFSIDKWKSGLGFHMDYDIVKKVFVSPDFWKIEIQTRPDFLFSIEK